MSAAVAIERELCELIPAALERESAKVIAFKTGCSTRQAEHWKYAENLPNGPYLLAVARAYPEVRRKLIELMSAEMGEADKSPAQMIAELYRAIHKLNGTPP